MARTKQIGDLAEVKFISRCKEKKYSVSIPFGEDQRYDLIVDKEGELFKVQVKASWQSNDRSTLHFNTSSNNSHSGTKTYKAQDVDVFGIYSRYTDSCFWVPFTKAPKSNMLLRLTPTKNGQSKGVNFAKDYIF